MFGEVVLNTPDRHGKRKLLLQSDFSAQHWKEEDRLAADVSMHCRKGSWENLVNFAHMKMKNFRISKFHVHICVHLSKVNRISTNMPCFGRGFLYKRTMMLIIFDWSGMATRAALFAAGTERVRQTRRACITYMTRRAYTHCKMKLKHCTSRKTWYDSNRLFWTWSTG